MATFKPCKTQGTQRGKQNGKRGFGLWCMRWAHVANASPKQQGMLSSHGEITWSETYSADFYA